MSGAVVRVSKVLTRVSCKERIEKSHSCLLEVTNEEKG